MARTLFLSAILTLLLAPVPMAAQPLPETDMTRLVSPAKPPARETFVEPTGDFAAAFYREKSVIDTLLLDNTPEQKTAIIQVVGNSEKFSPPVLYILARALFVDGQKDKAAFWYHSAQVRARFDAARCPDVSARQAVIIIEGYLGGPIRKYTYNDLPKLNEIVQRAVLWDELTAHDYDRRWIDPHGIGVIDEDAPKPHQWHDLAETNRANYVRGMENVIEELSLIAYEDRAPYDHEDYLSDNEEALDQKVDDLETSNAEYIRIGGSLNDL